MNKNKRQAAPPCDELCLDDGVDPRILFRKHGRKRTSNRKDRQLCKQVFQVLSLALDPLSAEDWARGMYVAAVVPAPDATRLRVDIDFIGGRSLDEALLALGRLGAISGTLRWELGAAISRKRVPELVFGLAGGEEVDDVETDDVWG